MANNYCSQIIECDKCLEKIGVCYFISVNKESSIFCSKCSNYIKFIKLTQKELDDKSFNETFEECLSSKEEYII